MIFGCFLIASIQVLCLADLTDLSQTFFRSILQIHPATMKRDDAGDNVQAHAHAAFLLREEEFDALMRSHPYVRVYSDCFGHTLAGFSQRQ